MSASKITVAGGWIQSQLSSGKMWGTPWTGRQSIAAASSVCQGFLHGVLPALPHASPVSLPPHSSTNPPGQVSRASSLPRSPVPLGSLVLAPSALLAPRSSVPVFPAGHLSLTSTPSIPFFPNKTCFV
ncbi:protein HUA2-LIKE 1-like [Micropterus dolomieu]|uniref:protein HUA2-LIKE 1-like n=1 Tax=Micropterus dolomieu TaxID=147949 RepID=UPI001E8D8BEC|nr:protein HUA2-LIKE 1-like [Micropterus dolomieu]